MNQYTIKQVSELVNLSKASIYNKLKSMDLEKHMVKKQGVTYLNEIGLNKIQCSLKGFEEDSTNTFKEPVKDLKDNETNTTLNDETAVDEEDSNVKLDYINFLKEQLQEKDSQLKSQLVAKDLQISNLNERLKNEQELNKNNQVLQLRQPQDTKELQEHFTLVDEKLTTMREEMNAKEKGWFNKLFKK